VHRRASLATGGAAPRGDFFAVAAKS